MKNIPLPYSKKDQPPTFLGTDEKVYFVAVRRNTPNHLKNMIAKNKQKIYSKNKQKKYCFIGKSVKIGTQELWCIS